MSKKSFMYIVLPFLMLFFFVSTAMAKQYLCGGRPLNLFAYVTQGVAYGLHDEYDTEEGVNQLLFNFLLEGDYSFTDNLKFYSSVMFTSDWAYDIKDGGSWDDRLFDQSSGNLHIDDEYWQLLKEIHVTWTSHHHLLRVGKQIVSWGETMGFRLMDQINPQDLRRGMADVEFETTIIPIWLLRAEYFPSISASFIQDIALEFIFNPNADFIPNQKFLGNDKGGIWSPNIFTALPPPPFGPGGVARIGSGPMTLEEHGEWDDDGFEYGCRLKGIVWDATITLNYFYGIADDPVTTMAPNPPEITVGSDGLLLLHPAMQGTYPRFKFTGATFSKDLQPLRATILGGVAPVLFLEAFYAFNSSFSTSLNTVEKSDELRYAVGVDWKIKIPFLNPRAYFFVSPQYYHQKIIDYPSGYAFLNIKEDNQMVSVMVNTSYFHNKIVPSVFWMHDIDNKADMCRLQLVYDYSNEWHYTLGGLFLNGQKPGRGFHVFENKDYLFFKVSYKWG